MTKESRSGGWMGTVLMLLIPLVLVAGCGTTSMPQYSTSVTRGAEPPAKSIPEPSTTETTTGGEHGKTPVVDEKNIIFFSLGSSAIAQAEKNKLRQIAVQLKNDKTKSVRLVGYAKGNGSSSFNLAVADARVQAVWSALRKLGVKPLQIKRSVTGSEKIPNTCRSVECGRTMRRVELVISATP